MAELSDLLVASLGEARFESPLAEFVADRRTNEHYVDEDDRVVFHDTVFQLSDLRRPPEELPSFEPGGPRRRLFFPPGATKVGVVTCGGLCPGLNDVIRGLVMELSKHYGVDEVLGFRHGYAGLVKGRAWSRSGSLRTLSTTSTPRAAPCSVRPGAPRIPTRWSTAW